MTRDEIFHDCIAKARAVRNDRCLIAKLAVYGCDFSRGGSRPAKGQMKPYSLRHFALELGMSYPTLIGWVNRYPGVKPPRPDEVDEPIDPRKLDDKRERKCLCCRQKFLSSGIANRLCKECRMGEPGSMGRDEYSLKEMLAR